MEVEQGLMAQEEMPTSYYPFYWIGLRMKDVWPNFAWVVPNSEHQAVMQCRLCRPPMGRLH